MEELMAAWSDGYSSEDELVRELLDDHSPFFVLPEKTSEPDKTSGLNEEAINRLISNVYSGPTIGDIDSALSVTPRKNDQLQELSQASRFGKLNGL
jgi:hypothetical protein